MGFGFGRGDFVVSVKELDDVTFGTFTRGISDCNDDDCNLSLGIFGMAFDEAEEDGSAGVVVEVEEEDCRSDDDFTEFGMFIDPNDDVTAGAAGDAEELGVKDG